ncbi:MAG TPA: RNA polymerase sigma factor [Thermomicrobiales bacterium]|nr:RNA polymerase sigma factor [Thermomicrobiales bacterium]
MEHPGAFHTSDGFAARIDQHRGWLLGWFARRCGDLDTAEDLAQETTLEAWRIRTRFLTADGERAWLSAIATNVLLRWRRAMVRHRSMSLLDDSATGADDESLEWWVERRELEELLDRALHALSIPSQRLLRDRYYLEQPIAEIAARNGITAQHAAVRLQRARKQLRVVVLDEFASEIGAFGCHPEARDGSQPTKFWCPLCGQHQLRMTLSPDRFSLTCPSCTANPGSFLYLWDSGPDEPVLTGIRTAPQALRRTLPATSWKATPADMPHRCSKCGAVSRPDFRVLPSRSADDLAALQIHFICSCDGPSFQSSTYPGMAIFHPAGTDFWRAHGKIRVAGTSEITFRGMPAVGVTLAATSSSEHRFFAFSRETAHLLLVD